MKQREVNDILTENYMDYARYTIQDRAIVDINDGMKNIHRRIVWSMYLDGLLHNKNRTKSVNAVGSVLRFSPHGDSSVYQACVRLTNDSVLNPLLDGKGAFSTITSRDMQEGASRYTEIRLAPISQEILKDINKDVVEMKNNYDDTRLEPKYMPVTFPLVLANPNLGIAVGISSNICSFNMTDIIDNTIKIIKKEKPSLMIPDLPTGGVLIYDENIIKDVNHKGVGKVKIRAKYKTEENSIIITEIPYTTTREVIIESIVDLVKNGKIKDIIDVNDYSGYEGLNITIDIKKNTNVNALLSKLFKMTPLESTFSCNFNVLHNNKPVTLGTFDIIDRWLIFRRECVSKSLQYDISHKSEKLHLLKGLEKVLLDIDRAINIIRKSKDEEIISNLSKTFEIDQTQSENIANMKLRNINKDYIVKQIKDIEKLEQEVEDLKFKLNSPDEINNIIINDLTRVRDTYSKPRKTEILYESDTIEISESELIEDYNCYISISKENYLYKYLRRTDNFKLKDNDEIIKTELTSNKTTLLMFTSLGNCYKLFLHDIQEKLPSQLGHYLPSLINLQQDEKIISVQVTRKYEGNLINIFSNNKLAKISMKSFKTDQKRSMLKNAISTESPLINQFIITEDIDIICKSSIDKVLITSTSQFNAKGSKNTNGDGLIKSKNDSTLVFCQPLDNIDKDKLDVEYYRGNRNAVGSYLKKEHSIQLLTKQ